MGAQVVVVGQSEIEENGWNLNIGRYIKTASADTMTVEQAIKQMAEAQSGLRDAERRLSERLRAAGYE